MDKRRVVSLLLLLAVVCGGLLFLWKAIGGSAPPAGSTPELASSDTGTARSGSRDNATLEAPAADTDGAEARERTSSTAAASNAAADREENFALESARWVEGTLKLPPDAPSDDSLLVWVVVQPEGASTFSNGDSADTGSAVAALRKKDRGGRWAHRAVDAQGKFKVPVPTDAKHAQLLVDGQFLYLPQTPTYSSQQLESPIVLEPELGACISVRCNPPPTATSEEKSDEVRATFRGFSMGGRGRGRGQSDYVQRTVDVHADSTFELRAVPAELRCSLSLVPKHLANAIKSEISLERGKTTSITADIKLGARVSGHVVDEERRPVPGAKVTSSARGGGMFFGGAGNEERSVETGADGAFELDGLRPGKQHLTASVENWADGKSDELTLQDEQRLTGVDILLTRGMQISGRVTWPDGRPAKEAGVQAIDASEKRARFGNARKTRGTTADEQGNFTIRGLEKGPFLVTATSRQVENLLDAVRVEKLVQDLSARSDAKKAAPPDAPVVAARVVGDGDGESEQSAKKVMLWVASLDDVKGGTSDVALVLHAPAGIAGHAVDEAGAPLREFTVEVNPDWMSGRVSSDRGMHVKKVNADDGAFFVDDVSDGDWRVTVRAEAYTQIGEAVSVRVPQTGEPLVVKMGVASTITGLVLDPLRKPVADADIQIRAQGESSRAQFASSSNSTKTDEKGAFSLKNISAGAWQLTASRDGWAKSEALPLQVAAGQNVTGVELALRAGGTIAGEVWDARGTRAAGRHVQMFSMTAGDSRNATVDAAGSFKSEHVTPGTYQVMLEPSEADQSAMMDKAGTGEQPDVADIFSKLKMTSCEVKEGEITRVVLGAPPKSPVKVTGRVTQGGEAVTKCVVVVINEGGSVMQSMKFGKVDGSGRYEVTLDKPGDVVLVVTKDFGRAKGVDFYLTVPEVEQFTADLALPVSAIRGTIRGPDGSPLAKFPVQLSRDASSSNILMMDGPPSESTDENGRYEFTDLNAGTYAVAAGGTSGPFGGGDSGGASYGRSVRGGLRLERDRVLDNVDLKLGSPGKIAGTVRDATGVPVSGAVVYARDAQGELLSRYSSCTSDAAGKFEYKGIAPGSYTLSARTKTLAARDGSAVAVRESETTEAEVVLESGTILRVSATDKDDKPLKAGISVKDERGMEVGNLMAVDAMQEAFAQGVSSTEQKIGPLPAGKYVVTATGPDGKTSKKAVTLKGQDERKLIVRVE